MGGFCSRACPSLLGDDSHIDPRLRPPPLIGVLFCLITTFCFIVWITSFRMSIPNMFLSLTLVAFFGAIGTTEGSAYERNYPSISLLIPLAIFSSLLPFYIGVKVYVNIYAPYSLAISGREYTDVPSEASTAEYADAGILRFAKDAALDTTRSFGFKADDYTYCVAPVVSRETEVHPSSSGPKVTFWAVGKDCCGSRREFECDGAGETEVRSAFTVQDIDHNFITKFLVPRTSRPQYLKAVDAAKAIHNLRSENDEKIILVRWAADPKDTLDVWYNRAMIAVGVSCMVYSVLITITWSLVHYYFDSDIRKAWAARGKDSGMAGGGGRPVKDPFMLGGMA